GGPVWDPLDPLYNIPDYLEGGAYILDEGDAVYPLQVADDENSVDPYETVEGNSGDYYVTFSYLIRYGQPNYTVDLQMGFDYNDIGLGETEIDAFGRSGETQYGIATHTASGTYSTTINVTTLADGDYIPAIRVTDDNGDVDVFVWPDLCPLWPGTAYVVIDDTAYSCPTQLQADLTTVWGDTVPLIQSTAVGSTTLQDYSLVFWVCGFGTSPSELTTTERTYLKNYLDNGGNVVLFITYDYYFYSIDSGDYQLNYVGFNRTTGYNHFGAGGYLSFGLAGNGYPASPIINGPGGNGANWWYYYSSSYPYYYYALIPGQYIVSGVDRWACWPYTSSSYWNLYVTSLHTDANGSVEGGNHVWFGIMYYNTTAYFNSSVGTRPNLLLNIINAIDPNQLPAT
ncbi:hypothetical protein JW859_07120, partial [bacterium]|nr:hypothetical protein [bacterium]